MVHIGMQEKKKGTQNVTSMCKGADIKFCGSLAPASCQQENKLNQI